MFIEPTITWVSSGFSGYRWLDTKIVLKKSLVADFDFGLQNSGKLVQHVTVF